jgi:hypothetical protein
MRQWMVGVMEASRIPAQSPNCIGRCEWIEPLVARPPSQISGAASADPAEVRNSVPARVTIPSHLTVFRYESERVPGRGRQPFGELPGSG